VTSAFERVCESLLQSRRDATPFTDAWTQALATLPPARPRTRESAHYELIALQATRSAWAAAYERRPATAQERAVVALINGPR
jgi:hypothetical protein